MPEDDGKIIALEKVRKAVAEARAEKPKKRNGGRGRPPPPPQSENMLLPPGSPVVALGYEGSKSHFLDVKGQRVSLEAKEFSRLNIEWLFGGDLTFLKAHFPRGYDRDGNVTAVDHAQAAPCLMRSIRAMGAWSPSDKERGVGAWSEDDGKTLVFHCGDRLVTSRGVRGIGLHGRYLYPAQPKVPEPADQADASTGAEDADDTLTAESWAAIEGTGARIMERLARWNFTRGFLDQMLVLGTVAAALLAAAPEWRPMMFFTGDSRTGKSTLLKGLKWIFGREAFISSGNATVAAVAQSNVSSCKPVILDELERGETNERVDKIIELMVLASSGETLDRGSPGGQTTKYQVRNCFICSAISLPGLRDQDDNRLFKIELNRLPPRDDDADDGEALVDGDPIWGTQDRCEQLGRELRARLLKGWPRYKATMAACQAALGRHHHDRRGQAQFGSALTAYDLVMFDDLDPARLERWAEMLDADKIAETNTSVSNHQQCADDILAMAVQSSSGNRFKPLGEWLQDAKNYKQSIALNTLSNDADGEAVHVLARYGLKVQIDKHTGEWIVCFAKKYEPLRQLLRGTKWGGSSGTTTGWAAMLTRLEGATTIAADGKPLRIRYGSGSPRFSLSVPWVTLFPGGDDDG